MFTGIVEDLGEVEAVEHLGDFARIHVRSSVAAQDARPDKPDATTIDGAGAVPVISPRGAMSR